MTIANIPIARDFMTTHVHTIAADSNVGDAVRMLVERGHSGAPVVDAGGAPLGILSEYDCIRVLAQAIADRWPEGRVTELMSSTLETVAPTDDVLTLATRFADGRHRRLLVVENGRLVGLISRHDLLRALESLERRAVEIRKDTTYELIEERRRELD